MTANSSEREYWGMITAMPAAFVGELASQAEARGMHGLFTPQVHGSPFTTLAAASVKTERVKLATGVVIAATRSPFDLAMTAMDMDRLSSGRFVLGLGASVHSFTSGLYGVPKRKPLTNLRETVKAFRYIVANAHKGLEPYESEYYTADFAEFQPTDPPVREEIPVWTAAIREKAVKVAGEIADGLLGHPIWSTEWAERLVANELAEGLAKAGRKRSDIHVSLWPWLAPNEDAKQAVEDSRGTVAFYSGIKQYESYFEAHGFGDEARRIQEPIAQGDLAAAAKLVPDEMVHTFVTAGSPEEVSERIERVWGVADSLCPVPPTWGLDPAEIFAYGERIAGIIAG